MRVDAVVKAEGQVAQGARGLGHGPQAGHLQRDGALPAGHTVLPLPIQFLEQGVVPFGVLDLQMWQMWRGGVG